ncbi:MAG: Ig-like domain-containing protein [Geminicoccaceae bacterium]
MAVYIGTSVNNTYTGTTSADTISGRGGNDTLFGGNGNDTLNGEAGNDSLSGGNGIDRLFGGNGNDWLFGGNDGDSLEGGNGSDSLVGGLGNDTLLGLAGNDVLSGGNGNDSLSGGSDADSVVASIGNDRIDGGAGDDILGGGDNADTVTGGSGNDSIDGGAGTDVLVLAGNRSTYTVTSLGAATYRVVDGSIAADGNDGSDRFTGIESVRFKDQTVALAALLNGPPDGVNDSIVTTEDAGKTGNLLGNDTDPNGDTLAVSAVNGAAGNVGSSFTLASGASVVVEANGNYSYDPLDAHQDLANGETATETFTYTVSDGKGGTDTATVRITVEGINDAPTAGDDLFKADWDAKLSGKQVLTNDDDADATDSLTVSAVEGAAANVGQDLTLASGAIVRLNADGTLDYDPNGAFGDLASGGSRDDSFTYTVVDELGVADTATVTVTVRGPNQFPIAVDDNDAYLNYAEIQSWSGNVLANDTDADNDELTVSAVNGSQENVGKVFTGPVGSQVVISSNGDFQYNANDAFPFLDQPGDDYTDSFSYTISDGRGGEATAMLIINFFIDEFF